MSVFVSVRRTTREQSPVERGGPRRRRFTSPGLTSPAASAAAVPINTAEAGREHVVEGLVWRIRIPGVGTGEPGCCQIRDDTASLWLVFPGTSRPEGVRLGAVVRAEGLVVSRGRGLAMIDPWIDDAGRVASTAIETGTSPVG